MDLTHLRPTASFLSSKARKQERMSRSVTRLSAWIAACTLVVPDQDSGWTDPPRCFVIYPFAPLSYSLHRLFAILLPAKLAKNPDRPTSSHFAAHNWSGPPSAVAPRSSQGVSSRMVFIDFAPWPTFCWGASSRNQNLGLERARKLAFARGAYG
jgi:hypothetical protein